MGQVLADFTKLELRHVKDFPVTGTHIVETDELPTGEGFFIIFLGRANNGDRVAKLFGTNMSVEEIIDDFLKAMAAVHQRGSQKINVA